MSKDQQNAAEDKDTNAGGAHDNPQPRSREREAVKKKACDPGDEENAAGMKGRAQASRSSDEPDPR